MPAQGLRFGINLQASESRSEWQDSARRAEDEGYDVILVPDHIGMPAPLPALMSAAAVTTRVRLGTVVLNAGFYRPALLARDAAGLSRLTDGRFELGLGAGADVAAEEFAAAELEFPGPRQRVDHLEHMVTEVTRMLTADGDRVPIMVAGQGDRVLRVAARHADIVNIAAVGGPAGSDPLRRRIDVIRSAAGSRFADLELSLLVPVVHLAGLGEPDLGMLRRFNPDLSQEELLALPGVLVGTESEIVDELHRYRDDYGISYVTTADHGRNRESMGAVINQVT